MPLGSTCGHLVDPLVTAVLPTPSASSALTCWSRLSDTTSASVSRSHAPTPPWNWLLFPFPPTDWTVSLLSLSFLLCSLCIYPELISGSPACFRILCTGWETQHVISAACILQTVNQCSDIVALVKDSTKPMKSGKAEGCGGSGSVHCWSSKFPLMDREHV